MKILTPIFLFLSLVGKSQTPINNQELRDLYYPYSKNVVNYSLDEEFKGPQGIFLYGYIYDGVKEILLSRNIKPVKEDFYDVTFMEIFSGMKIYKSGKTSVGKYHNRNNFSYYNPYFINWVKNNLIPNPDFVVNGKPMIHWYQYFKRFFRLMTESYFYTVKIIDYEHDKSEYQFSAIKSDFNGLDYLKKKYSGNLKGYEVPKELEIQSPFEDYMAIGFWLRRGIDNTEDEFFGCLSYLMTQYDQAWFYSINKKYALMPKQ